MISPAQIWADNGFAGGNTFGSPTFWSECEVLGDAAVVKVRAADAALTSIRWDGRVLPCPGPVRGAA